MEVTNFVLPEHAEFLNKLRDEGNINMYEAVWPLQQAFSLESKDAERILRQWMQHPNRVS